MFQEKSPKHKIKHKNGKRPPTSKAKVPGVRAAATALGVTPGHLWHVVMGLRESKRLTRRYSEYLAQKGAAK